MRKVRLFGADTTGKDRFIVLGDEYQGIALIKESNFLNILNEVKKEGEQYE